MKWHVFANVFRVIQVIRYKNIVNCSWYKQCRSYFPLTIFIFLVFLYYNILDLLIQIYNYAYIWIYIYILLLWRGDSKFASFGIDLCINQLEFSGGIVVCNSLMEGQEDQFNGEIKGRTETGPGRLACHGGWRNGERSGCEVEF